MAEHLADLYPDAHADAHGYAYTDADRDEHAYMDAHGHAHEAPDRDENTAPDEDPAGDTDTDENPEAYGNAMNDMTREQRVEACIAYCAGDRPKAATLRYFGITVSDMKDYYARREQGGKG